jgi:hypothetical protein
LRFFLQRVAKIPIKTKRSRIAFADFSEFGSVSTDADWASAWLAASMVSIPAALLYNQLAFAVVPKNSFALCRVQVDSSVL